jgi:O-antigen/teichoic acid export membrane protein
VNLKNRFIKNSFFNIIGYIWSLLLTIITLPIIIKHLGVEQYGILVLIFLFLGYFAFLDLGLGEATVKFVSKYSAKGETEKINRIINSVLCIHFFIGILGLVIICLFTKFYAIELFDISPKYSHSAQICFYLTGFGFLLNIMMSVLSKIPEGMQRFDIGSKITILLATIVSILNVTVVLIGGKLLSFVLVNLFGSILGIFAYYIYSKAIFQELKINFRFSKADFKETFSFGIYILFSKIANSISSSMYQMIIGIILGPAAVAIYNVPVRLVSKLQIAAYKIIYVLFPIISELKSENQIDRIRRIYEIGSKYCFFIVSVLCISTVSFSYYILNYWIGPDFANQGSTVFVLLALGYYLHSIGMVPSIIANGMGNPKFNAIFSLLFGIISILLLIILSPKYGLIGSATAFLISSLHVPVFIFIINRKILKISNSKYFKNVFFKGSIVFVLLTCIYIFGFRLLVKNIIGFFLILLLSFLISSIAFYIHIEKEDQREILAKLKGIYEKIIFNILIIKILALSRLKKIFYLFK